MRKKLTEKDIRIIKSLYNDKGLTLKEIADLYNMVPSSIHYNLLKDKANRTI